MIEMKRNKMEFRNFIELYFDLRVFMLLIWFRICWTHQFKNWGSR